MAAKPSYRYLFFLGKPASGKGTQIRLLLEKFEGRTFSTGDALKDHIARGTELGKRVKEIINAGKLVSDDIVMDLFQDAAERLPETDDTALFLVDGFPRTAGQYDLLKSYLVGRGVPAAFLYFTVDDDLVLRRLSGRLVCNGCFAPFTAGKSGATEGEVCPQCRKGTLIRRSDDSEAAMQKRLAEYRSLTAPMIERIASEERDRFLEIDGTRAADVIFEELVREALFTGVKKKRGS